MKFQFLTGLVIILLATCSVQPATIHSGVQGQVFIGPSCPVVQIGQPCPDKTYQATLTIKRADGGRVTQAQTDDDGRFTIQLPPGEYILHPESPNMIPFAPDQTFTVQSNSFTELIVTYDSGIR